MTHPMKLDVRYINPFIEGVQNTFVMMLESTAERGRIALSSSDAAPGNCVALIGLSGAYRGAVALQMPKATALAIVGRLLGQEFTEIDSTVTDGIAEMVNIISGQAKAKLGELEGDLIELGLPSVVYGTDYTINYPSKAVWLDMPFTSGLGDFKLRVTLQHGDEQLGSN